MCNCVENTIIQEKYYFPPKGCNTPHDIQIKVVKMGNREVHVPLEEYDKLIPGINITTGNDKTGEEIQILSLPIFYTCKHNAPCFKCKEGTIKYNKLYDTEVGENDCYGCGNNFEYHPDNAIRYAETFKAFQTWNEERLVNEIISKIKPETRIMRWFEIGDLNPKILRVMIKVADYFLAIDRDIKFYPYTKKYEIVNDYVANHGGSIQVAIPSNLNILFSEWEGLDMPNPYGFAVSSFVPFAKRNDITLEEGDFICPCSFPEWGGTCFDCGQCANVKPGKRVYLIEHSTQDSKKADKEAHAKQKALKEARGALKASMKALEAIGGSAYNMALKAWEAFKAEHIDRFLKRG